MLLSSVWRCDTFPSRSCADQHAASCFPRKGHPSRAPIWCESLIYPLHPARGSPRVARADATGACLVAQNVMRLRLVFRVAYIEKKPLLSWRRQRGTPATTTMLAVRLPEFDFTRSPATDLPAARPSWCSRCSWGRHLPAKDGVDRARRRPAIRSPAENGETTKLGDAGDSVQGKTLLNRTIATFHKPFHLDCTFRQLSTTI